MIMNQICKAKTIFRNGDIDVPDIKLNVRTNKYTNWLSFILMLTFSISSHAHEDRIITLEDGNLIGLPKEYQPSEFNLGENRLRIGNHTMHFHEYIQGFIPKGEYELEFLSSWYPEDSIPYLIMRIIPANKGYSYTLYFNLDTLDLLVIQVVIHEEDRTRGLSIKLNEGLKREIKATITIERKRVGL